MLTRTFYYEIQRVKNDKQIGVSFRVTTIWFWESVINMLKKDFKEIEDKFNCEVYLSNMKRIV